MTMISEEDLVAQFTTLSTRHLHKWIRMGWVRPERREGAAIYHEVDVARVRLLHDLETTLEFDEDTVPLILSLLDQVHTLRHQLKSLAAAIDEQPPVIRERIRTAFSRHAEQQ